MAGISRSVTLTIAYLMSNFSLSMQNAYQFVKDKRPAISPNLNFMGQLVEFERELELSTPLHSDLSKWLPSSEQQQLSQKLKEKVFRTPSVSSISSIPSPTEKDGVHTRTSSFGPQQPFFLKPLNSKGSRKKVKVKSSEAVNTTSSVPGATSLPLTTESQSNNNNNSSAAPEDAAITTSSSSKLSPVLTRLSVEDGQCGHEREPIEGRLPRGPISHT